MTALWYNRRLPPLLEHHTFAGHSIAAKAQELNNVYDDHDIVGPERTPPPPDPTRHQRKRSAQWKRWQGEVIPAVIPYFVRLLYKTKSLRHTDDLELLQIPSRTTCACNLKNSLRHRFGNCLMWYIHLRQQTKERYSKLLKAARVIHLGVAKTAEDADPPLTMKMIDNLAGPHPGPLAGVSPIGDVQAGQDCPLPQKKRTVLDRYEASFKAADEKQEKASTEFFEDTAIMGLLCRHDRVLWLVNMHSAGEKQFNVVVLLETLFQHLPLDIWVGLLYDLTCAFERSCRLAFAVSVCHVFGHEWACQLLYHPCKHVGFGFSNGEGCERFWHLISHLITNLCIYGIEHADEGSLTRLGEWIRHRHLHSVKKHLAAQDVLRESGQMMALLRAQWALQVTTQTRPLPRHSKNKGQDTVNGVILQRAAVKTRKTQLAQLRESFLDAVAEEDPDAAQQSLKNPTTSEYISLRMNARALKRRRLRDRLRLRKFELDKMERSFRRLVNESAVKRCEPTISKVNNEYNKLCGQITQEGKALWGTIAPVPSPAKGIRQLDVDDGIWQDVGLDDNDREPGSRVRSGIKAMLELDRCDEEDIWLKKERCSLQVWFAEEWAVVNVAMEMVGKCFIERRNKPADNGFAESKADRYQLQLLRDNLVSLCATWDRALPDLGVATSALPAWGPSAGELSTCAVDAHIPAQEDRHYRESWSNEDDESGGEESGGEEEDFVTLALETAHIYYIYNSERVLQRCHLDTLDAEVLPRHLTSNGAAVWPGTYFPLASYVHHRILFPYTQPTATSVLPVLTSRSPTRLPSKQPSAMKDVKDGKRIVIILDKTVRHAYLGDGQPLLVNL
ncbi:hypothetical protein DFH09DRAFT_1073649 [Mycena vulgaris]|nr:hypothetical protein DFH09DRAFT_1073649 [Mycena vulgaris]